MSMNIFAVLLGLFWPGRVLLINSMEISLEFGYTSDEDILTRKSDISLHICYKECQAYPESCTVCSVSPTTGRPECDTRHCFQSERPIPYSTLLGTLNNIGSKRIHKCHGTSDSGSTGALSECLVNGSWAIEDIKCLPFSKPYADQYFESRWAIPMDTYNDISRSDCILKCYEDIETCKSVNYHASTRRCDKSLGHIGRNIQLQGWEALHKIFPVVARKSSSSQTYDLNHSSAAIRCQQLSTQMAQLSDVQDAYDIGYSICLCGFVLDDIVPVIPMHFDVANCFKAGIHQCGWMSDKGDVFCKNNKFYHP